MSGEIEINYKLDKDRSALFVDYVKHMPYSCDEVAQAFMETMIDKSISRICAKMDKDKYKHLQWDNE